MTWSSNKPSWPWKPMKTKQNETSSSIPIPNL
jgi:hypothetical protein